MPEERAGHPGLTGARELSSEGLEKHPLRCLEGRVGRGERRRERETRAWAQRLVAARSAPLRARPSLEPARGASAYVPLLEVREKSTRREESAQRTPRPCRPISRATGAVRAPALPALHLGLVGFAMAAPMSACRTFFLLERVRCGRKSRVRGRRAANTVSRVRWERQLPPCVSFRRPS